MIGLFPQSAGRTCKISVNRVNAIGDPFFIFHPMGASFRRTSVDLSSIFGGRANVLMNRSQLLMSVSSKKHINFRNSNPQVKK